MGLNSEGCGEMEIGTGKFLGVGGLSLWAGGNANESTDVKEKRARLDLMREGAFQNRS